MPDSIKQDYPKICKYCDHAIQTKKSRRRICTDSANGICHVSENDSCEFFRLDRMYCMEEPYTTLDAGNIQYAEAASDTCANCRHVRIKGDVYKCRRPLWRLLFPRVVMPNDTCKHVKIYEQMQNQR